MEIPPQSPSPESLSISTTASKHCLVPRQRTSRTIYHLCKRIMKPVQMELLLLAKRDLSRWHKELQNFHHCIRNLGHHLQACLRKFCNLQEREDWEVDSNNDFNIFKVTYEKLRFNFLATQLLIGSCDLQQLYRAWGLCGACTCSDSGLMSLNCIPQSRQLQREINGEDTRSDSREGLLKAAVSSAKQRQRGGCSPETCANSRQSTNGPNTEGAASHVLKRG
ncbi:hypothetical protein AAFF_G00055000 [Aldrovandia affinis]|uniref:Uncharacterized protein n=1 Tax=Aldrovandia affinis TaxID=143900 RepID=A0AAD7S1C5_9TELE|nr:hypothetical protein AAFF_G00055000 [Aldrovandia affinis]